MVHRGFAAFGWASYQFGGLTLGIGQWTLTWPIIVSGIAAGMVFVPLTTTTMGTLGNEQIGNASGLFNLLRNMGGSIGISAVNTLLARQQQAVRAEMVAHLTRGSIPFGTLLSRAQALMSLHVGPGLSARRALALADQMLQQQAAALSYVDVFRLIAFLSLACVPVVFLLKGVRGRGRPGGH